MPTQRRTDPLVVANLAFVAAILLHGADHVRRGTSDLTHEVYYGGGVLALIGFSTLWFTLRRDRRAPLVAAVVGLWTALVVSAAHLAPHWSAFSDPYPDKSLDAFAWIAMLSEVVAALVLGLIGLAMLRARTAGSRPAPA